MGGHSTYICSSGETIRLGRRLAGGGEGEIFELAGDSKLVAKLYKKPPEARKAKKLLLMVQMANPSLSRFAAWPIRALYRGVDRRLCGFVMNRVADARPVHELDTPAGRRANFPNADWRFLIRTARNCAAAMAALHNAGIVLGDVNLGGFLVTRDAIVNVIDCDSFQVQASGEIFLCEVAVPEFLPPELHGRPLQSTVRTTNHDAFGLAIIIFRLLMMGRHPFAGYQGRGDKPIPEAIREYRFAFGPDANVLQMAPPPHSVLLSDLPSSIASNFVQTFSRGSDRDGVRPSAKIWHDSLAQLESQLQKCGTDPAHYHFSGLKACPWCRIERGNGPNYFITASISVLSATPSTVDISSIWAQIVTIPGPSSWTAGISQAAPTCNPAPLPAGFHSDKAFINFMGYVALVSGVLVFIPPIGFLVCACVVFVWLMLRANSLHHKEIQAREKTLASRKADFQTCERSLQNVVTSKTMEFQRKHDELRKIKDRFDSIKRLEEDELKEYQSQARERQLNAFLDRYFIKSAKLKGIGSSRIAALESYNIETAADVVPYAIASVPGFGPKLTEQLVRWRKGLEGKFRFDPVRGLPQADLLKIRNKYLQMRHAAQRHLEAGLGELRRCAVSAKLEIDSVTATLNAKLTAFAQANADFQLCSVPKSV